MQRLYIAEELSPKASEFFSELHGTYSYLQDERVQNQAKCDRLREEIRSLEAQREALAQSLTAAAEAQP